jgi:hypothetical protein
VYFEAFIYLMLHDSRVTIHPTEQQLQDYEGQNRDGKDCDPVGDPTVCD